MSDIYGYFDGELPEKNHHVAVDQEPWILVKIIR
jgi:hypothetical protein